MRLFVGLELPERIRLAVAELLECLRSDLPPARWSRPENVHLTLVFLGATDPGQLPGLASALRSAFAGQPQQRLDLGSAGVFPGARRARVLWLGVDGGAPLARLQAEVESAATSSLGLEAERRRFHPHLTLGRCRERWRREGVERFLAAAQLETEPFTIRHGTLFESHLGPEGARYEVCATFPLAGSGVAEVAS